MARGEWRYAWYRSSTADGIAADQSIDAVRRVVIELYSDQCRGTIAHKYAGTPDFDNPEFCPLPELAFGRIRR